MIRLFFQTPKIFKFITQNCIIKVQYYKPKRASAVACKIQNNYYYINGGFLKFSFTFFAAWTYEKFVGFQIGGCFVPFSLKKLDSSEDELHQI